MWFNAQFAYFARLDWTLSQDWPLHIQTDGSVLKYEGTPQYDIYGDISIEFIEVVVMTGS